MTKTECQTLAERFEKKALAGLVDVKFLVSNPSEADAELVCEEVNRLYAAIEQGEFRPLDFNDARPS
ncbi:hypothetical protein [Tardiphaga sp. 862_B3_N1_1]|uniref:hypothetical protein n=1 Tax=Tardiphaga sp. 862_B3_N1_1 TaxID=3240763 RepID=UPI003F8ACCA5